MIREFRLGSLGYLLQDQRWGSVVSIDLTAITAVQRVGDDGEASCVAVHGCRNPMLIDIGYDRLVRDWKIAKNAA